MSYKLESCYGMMPNQSTGELNGKRFYFRARRGYWDLSVGNTDDEAIDGELVEEGKEEKAGWWDDVTHRAFVTALLEKHSGPSLQGLD